MKKLILFALLLTPLAASAQSPWAMILPPAPTHNFFFTPTIYYVRANGGIRYSATYHPTGDSCNGLSSAAVSTGGGANQTCAWNDPRYTWADGSATGLMALSAGDTLDIAPSYPGGQTAWRFAGATNLSGGLFNGYAGIDSTQFTEYNLPFPTNVTIRGSNFASCGAGQKTNIFGGFSTLFVINLQAANGVALQCLDISDHSDCIKHGTAGLPSVCSNSVPITDYANSGILTSNPSIYLPSDQAKNITMTDLDIHGFPHSGLGGSIGGAITMTRVDSSRNGFAGWDFDYSAGVHGWPNNPASGITASYVTMDWNGCNEQYPRVDPNPITYCYSIVNQGFGDAWSGQDSNLAYMHCDHCTMDYNVKDPFFGPHTAIADIIITNSTANNNGGQIWKANLGSSGHMLMQNVLTNDNCRRLAQPVTGTPSTFNTYIDGADYCRADGTAIAMVWPVTGSFEVDDSTFITASRNTSFDFSCWNAFSAVSVGSGGIGYTVGDVLYPGGTQATVTVTSVSGGVVTGLSLTNPGQVTNSTVPFTETYVWGGTGSGATVTVTAVTPVNCGGGPRVLRNNNFIGYTNINTGTWNGQTIGWACYSGCQGNPGDSNDTQWTNRTNNNFYSYKAGTGAASYPGETTASPLMVVQPSQTWVDETQLDSFDPLLSAGSNSFYPDSGSPLIAAGITIGGIATDYFGAVRPNPPTIGGVEPGGEPTVADPVASPPTNTYVGTQSMTWATATSGSTICIRSGGTPPAATTPGTCDGGSTTYSGAVSIPASIVWKGLATKSGDANSGVVTVTYVITAPPTVRDTIKGTAKVLGISAAFP